MTARAGGRFLACVCFCAFEGAASFSSAANATQPMQNNTASQLFIASLYAGPGGLGSRIDPAQSRLHRLVGSVTQSLQSQGNGFIGNDAVAFEPMAFGRV